MSLADDIAERIASGLAEGGVLQLPSGRALSNHYGVSRSVMNRALRILAEQGLIRVTPRRRATVMSSSQPQALPSVSSSDRLFREIMADIATGVYSTNKPLPKIQFFVAGAKVSAHTVRAVFNRLITEGAAHRIRGKIIVGPCPRHDGADRIAASSVIFLLLDRPGDWVGLDRSPRTRPFCSALAAEARRSGIRLVIALTRTDPVYPSAEGMPKGIDEIMRAVADFGDRYLGTILPLDFQKVLGGNENLLRMLLAVKRPVVWFDRIGRKENPELSNPGFLRCYHSEQANVSAAIKFVVAWGHRSLAYIYSQSDDWSCARLEMIRQEAARLGSGIKVHGVPVLSLESWENPQHSLIPQILERLRTFASPPVRRSIARLTHNRNQILSEIGDYCPGELRQTWGAPVYALVIAWLRDHRRLTKFTLDTDTVLGGVSLCEAFADGTVTCIIAPNDRQGLHHHLAWLRRAGVRVPNDVSLISFDDEYRDEMPPLTTVSPGFDTAAYQTIHFIKGDIPIPGICQGELPCHASVVDNGSVGPVPGKPQKWQ